MLGSFISKHGIKTAVVLLIAGAVFNFTTVKTSVPATYQAYQVDNNTILYNGTLEQKLLEQIGTYFQEMGLFGKATKVTFMIDQLSKQQQSTVIFLFPIDPMKMSERVRKAFCVIGMDVRNRFFTNTDMNLCLTEMETLKPIECFSQEQILAITGVKEQEKKERTEPQQTEPQGQDNNRQGNESNSNQIIARWDAGATRISKASHFHQINGNDIWRLYYTEEYKDAASGVTNTLAESQLLSKEYYDYFAFYAAEDNNFFNGDLVFHFAIPYDETELNNGECEKKTARLYKVLKAGYLSDYKLVMVICDYDFNPVKYYSE